MNHSMYASPHVASTLLNLGSLWPYFTHEMETREAVSAHASVSGSVTVVMFVTL